MISVDSSVTTMMPESKGIKCSEMDPTSKDTSIDSLRWSSGMVKSSSRRKRMSLSTRNRQRELREESARLEARNTHLRDILKELKAKKEKIEALNVIPDTKAFKLLNICN
ncbi:unnamed protein product [Meganyctiphanes norvegica]|uniref:Uncharacterized protein n=1 Tax=Meganyctiphanes norvegica TaxID=48144 RepID=A0AAV2SQ39_MEGNR